MLRFRVVFLLITALIMAVPVQARDGGVESLRQSGKAFASVARAVSPSVVFIQVEIEATGSAISRFSSPFGDGLPFGDELLKRFFGDQFPGVPKMPKPQTPRDKGRVTGQGSGFIFTAKDGLFSDKTYIMTNYHVVENADKIRIRFKDGRQFTAKITGRDPQSDIAVVELKASEIPALSMADSSL